MCACAYFVFALVAAAQRALHGVAALHSDLAPHDDAGGRLLGALYDETAAAHAEGRGDLGQDFRKSLGGNTGSDEVPVNKTSMVWGKGGGQPSSEAARERGVRLAALLAFR